MALGSQCRVLIPSSKLTPFLDERKILSVNIDAAGNAIFHTIIEGRAQYVILHNFSAIKAAHECSGYTSTIHHTKFRLALDRLSLWPFLPIRIL